VKDKTKAALIFGLIFIHFLLISIQVPRGDRPTYFERGVFALISPLRAAASALFRDLGKWRNQYLYFRQVQRQNQKLRDDIFYLRQENLVLKNALERFRSESEIQALWSAISKAVIAGSVVGFDSAQIYKSVTLNRGSLDGVKRNMVVLDRRGRLIGRVIEPVVLKQSRVQLITDEDCGVGVRSERHGVLGVLEGDGQGNCRMKYVFKTNREIEAGESVLTSGFDGIYPGGIPVGKIISISENATVFKSIVVEPYFDFSELDRVAILSFDLRDF